MKAIVYTEYGSPEVLHPAEVEKPTPAPGQILVRVHATPVAYGDLLARNFGAVTRKEFNMPTPLLPMMRMAFGAKKPRKNILGSEFSGVVAATGAVVTRFNVGDEVFGYTGQNFGAYAEYVCVPEDSAVARKPGGMSFEEAAGVPYGFMTAHGILSKVKLRAGQKVLVNGASGGIGAAVVQLASAAGAEVTGVCGAPRMDTVRQLGAVHVIDYRREDFTEGSQKYDLIVDVLGRCPFSKSRRVLNPGGIHLYASFKTGKLFEMAWTGITGGRKVICAMSSESQEKLELARRMVEDGKYRVIIDRRYPLEQAAQAHQYAESGDKRGAIILTV